jgi:hypothetical protein
VRALRFSSSLIGAVGAHPLLHRLYKTRIWMASLQGAASFDQ